MHTAAQPANFAAHRSLKLTRTFKAYWWLLFTRTVFALPLLGDQSTLGDSRRFESDASFILRTLLSQNERP